jgi:hypothetical protein
MVTQLADLLLLLRQRSNLEANNFCTDEELTTYLNLGGGEMWGAMGMTYEDYGLDTFLAALGAGQNEIPLPLNCDKVRGVDYNPANLDLTHWYTLYPIGLSERNRYNNPSTSVAATWYKANLGYRLLQSSILIMPQDQASGNYQVWFTPKFQPLVNLTDTLPANMDTNAWHEFMVVAACIKVMNKRNFDPSGFMMEKVELKDRILNEAKNRNSGGPKRMANSRYQNDLCYPFAWYDI